MIDKTIRIDGSKGVNFATILGYKGKIKHTYDGTYSYIVVPDDESADEAVGILTSAGYVAQIVRD